MDVEDFSVYYDIETNEVINSNQFLSFQVSM